MDYTERDDIMEGLTEGDENAIGPSTAIPPVGISGASLGTGVLGTVEAASIAEANRKLAAGTNTVGIEPEPVIDVTTTHGPDDEAGRAATEPDSRVARELLGDEQGSS